MEKGEGEGESQKHPGYHWIMAYANSEARKVNTVKLHGVY